MKATITVTTTKDGQTTEFVQFIEGTKEEIAAVVAKRKGVDVKITSEN